MDAVLSSQLIQAARVGAATAEPLRLPVPADPATMPAAPEGLQGFFLWLCVASNPNPKTDQIDLKISKLQKFIDFVHDFLLGFAVVFICVTVKLFAALTLEA